MFQMTGTTNINLYNPWQLCGYNLIVGQIRTCCALPSKQKVKKAITQSNQIKSLAAARNRAAWNSTVSVSRAGSCAWIATATIAWTAPRTWRSATGQFGLPSKETHRHLIRKSAIGNTQRVATANEAVVGKTTANVSPRRWVAPTDVDAWVARTEGQVMNVKLVRKWLIWPN